MTLDFWKDKGGGRSFSTLLLLLVSISPAHLTSQVTVTLNTRKILATMDEKFLSFTVDPEELATRSYGPISKSMVQVLAPAYLRIAGSSSNNYTLNGDCINMNSHVIHKYDWKEFINFLQRAGVRVVLCLNVLHRMHNVWDSSSALAIVNAMEKIGLDLDYQIGYENQEYLLDFTSDEVAANINRLRNILKSFQKSAGAHIVGPDFTQLDAKDAKQMAYIQNFIRAASTNVDAITVHPSFSLEKDVANAVAKTMEVFDDNMFSKAGSERKPIWLAESELEEKAKGFEATLRVAQELGAAVRLGVDVFLMRPQPFCPENPTPDFWFAALYKALIGTIVLSIRTSSTQLSTHVHCTRPSTNSNPNNYEPGSVTIFGTNPGSADVHMYLRFSPFRDEMAHIFVLTSDDITGKSYLNGNELIMATNGDLPIITPIEKELLTGSLAKSSPNNSIEIPKRSIFFIVLPENGAKSCSLNSVSHVLGNRVRNNKIASSKSLDSRRTVRPKDQFYDPDWKLPKITTARAKSKYRFDLGSDGDMKTKYVTFSDNDWLSKYPEKNHKNTLFDDEFPKNGVLDMNNYSRYRRHEYSNHADDEALDFNDIDNSNGNLEIPQKLDMYGNADDVESSRSNKDSKYMENVLENDDDNLLSEKFYLKKENPPTSGQLDYLMSLSKEDFEENDDTKIDEKNLFIADNRNTLLNEKKESKVNENEIGLINYSSLGKSGVDSTPLEKITNNDYENTSSGTDILLDSPAYKETINVEEETNKNFDFLKCIHHDGDTENSGFTGFDINRENLETKNYVPQVVTEYFNTFYPEINYNMTENHTNISNGAENEQFFEIFRYRSTKPVNKTNIEKNHENKKMKRDVIFQSNDQKMTLKRKDNKNENLTIEQDSLRRERKAESKIDDDKIVFVPQISIFDSSFHDMEVLDHVKETEETKMPQNSKSSVISRDMKVENCVKNITNVLRNNNPKSNDLTNLDEISLDQSTEKRKRSLNFRTDFEFSKPYSITPSKGSKALVNYPSYKNIINHAMSYSPGKQIQKEIVNNSRPAVISLFTKPVSQGQNSNSTNVKPKTENELSFSNVTQTNVSNRDGIHNLETNKTKIEDLWLNNGNNYTKISSMNNTSTSEPETVTIQLNDIKTESALSNFAYTTIKSPLLETTVSNEPLTQAEPNFNDSVNGNKRETEDDKKKKWNINADIKTDGSQGIKFNVKRNRGTYKNDYDNMISQIIQQNKDQYNVNFDEKRSYKEKKLIKNNSKRENIHSVDDVGPSKKYEEEKDEDDDDHNFSLRHIKNKRRYNNFHPERTAHLFERNRSDNDDLENGFVNIKINSLKQQKSLQREYAYEDNMGHNKMRGHTKPRLEKIYNQEEELNDYLDDENDDNLKNIDINYANSKRKLKLNQNVFQKDNSEEGYNDLNTDERVNEKDLTDRKKDEEGSAFLKTLLKFKHVNVSNEGDKTLGTEKVSETQNNKSDHLNTNNLRDSIPLFTNNSYELKEKNGTQSSVTQDLKSDNSGENRNQLSTEELNQSKRILRNIYDENYNLAVDTTSKYYKLNKNQELVQLFPLPYNSTHNQLLDSNGNTQDEHLVIPKTPLKSYALSSNHQNDEIKKPQNLNYQPETKYMFEVTLTSTEPPIAQGMTTKVNMFPDENPTFAQMEPHQDIPTFEKNKMQTSLGFKLPLILNSKKEEPISEVREPAAEINTKQNVDNIFGSDYLTHGHRSGTPMLYDFFSKQEAQENTSPFVFPNLVLKENHPSVVDITKSYTTVFDSNRNEPLKLNPNNRFIQSPHTENAEYILQDSTTLDRKYGKNKSPKKEEDSKETPTKAQDKKSDIKEVDVIGEMKKAFFPNGIKKEKFPKKTAQKAKTMQEIIKGLKNKRGRLGISKRKKEIYDPYATYILERKKEDENGLADDKVKLSISLNNGYLVKEEEIKKDSKMSDQLRDSIPINLLKLDHDLELEEIKRNNRGVLSNVLTKPENQKALKVADKILGGVQTFMQQLDPLAGTKDDIVHKEQKKKPTYKPQHKPLKRKLKQSLLKKKFLKPLKMKSIKSRSSTFKLPKVSKKHSKRTPLSFA